MLIVKNNSNDPAFNLALEEALFEESNDDVFMLWINAPAVIVGQNQVTEAEIDSDYTARNGIKVIRRMTGGGAVYHDLNNVNFTWIRRNAKERFLDFKYFNLPVIETLKSFDINADTTGRNDITVDGKKISGGAQRLRRNDILHHGTLLFDTDIDVMTKALTPNVLKTESKGVTSVRARVGNLNQITGGRVTIEAVCQALLNDMAKKYLGEIVDAKDTEYYQTALKLKKEKYDTWDWNFGSSADYDIVKTAYTAGGLVEVRRNVSGGVIHQISIKGDFWGALEIKLLEERLVGTKCDPSEVEKVLTENDYTKYMANVPLSDVIPLLT